MTSDKHSVRAGKGGEVCIQEVADMNIDAWGTKLASVLLDNRFALRTDLKGADLKMRKLQTGFDRDAACTETDVPEDALLAQFEGL